MNIKNFKISYKDDRGIIKGSLIQKKKINAITYIKSIKINIEEITIIKKQ